MGIMLLPFILISFLIYLISFFKLYKGIKAKQLTFEIIFIGCSISSIIFVLIYFVFKMFNKAWAFSPHFIFIFSLIFLPYILTRKDLIYIKIINNELIYSLFVSIVFSFSLLMINVDKIDLFLDKIGVEKIY